MGYVKWLNDNSYTEIFDGTDVIEDLMQMVIDGPNTHARRFLLAEIQRAWLEHEKIMENDL